MMADGLLFVCDDKGTLSLVEATPEESGDTPTWYVYAADSSEAMWLASEAYKPLPAPVD